MVRISQEPAHATMVEALWAQDQVRDLALRYAAAMDARDEPAMLSLWSTASPGVALPDMDLDVVKDAVVPSWSSRGESIMLVANHVVSLESSDTATGTVYSLVRLEIGGRFVEQQVAYVDRYVRESGVWLFLTRRHVLAFGHAWEVNPFDGRDARWPHHQTGRGELWPLARQGVDPVTVGQDVTPGSPGG